MKLKLNYESNDKWSILEYSDTGSEEYDEYELSDISPTMYFESESIALNSPILQNKEMEMGEEHEKITINLKPWNKSSVYILGSPDVITSYQLEIFHKSIASKNSNKTKNYIIASDDIDGEGGWLVVRTFLSDKSFAALKEKINYANNLSIQVVLENIPGAYSCKYNWDKVKFLSNNALENLELPEEVDFNPPSIPGFFENGISLDVRNTQITNQYSNKKVHKIIDQILNHPKLSGFLNTTRYVLYAIMVILVLESIKNTYFS